MHWRTLLATMEQRLWAEVCEAMWLACQLTVYEMGKCRVPNGWTDGWAEGVIRLCHYRLSLD